MPWGDRDQVRTIEELLANIPTREELLPSRSGVGDPNRGYVDHQNLRDLIVTAFAAVSAAGGAIRIFDAVPEPGHVVSDKVYQDDPVQQSVLQSFVSDYESFELVVYSTFPLVRQNGSTHVLTLAADGGHYEGTIPVTVSESGDVKVESITPNGATGAFDTVSVDVQTPPEILTLEFIGAYPGAQTELKAGDTFQVQGTTDKDCAGVRVLDHEACQLEVIDFPDTQSFIVSVTIADRGDVAVERVARLQPKNAAGAYGSAVDTSNTVLCNNLHPSVVPGGITYPGVQQALKDSEQATVTNAISDFDTVAYSSPGGELSIVSPGLFELNKVVTRLAGDYNISTPNFHIAANRAANDATTETDTVVNIAHVDPEVSIGLPAARLRSGGNDGTVIQSHSIQLLSNQQLLEAPLLSEEAGGGTFTGVWTGGPSVWTRVLQVHDDDVKGLYDFHSLAATNLAGKVVSVVTGSTQYELGGFVQRNVTFSPFSQTEDINVAVVNYAKLQAGIFTATNQPAVRHSPQGDHADALNEYTVDSIGTNPTAVWWNDVAAASSNSSGTAQLTDLEEVV